MGGVIQVDVPAAAPEQFRAAVAQVRDHVLRPEVSVNVVPAPVHIAPWALAMEADVARLREEAREGLEPRPAAAEAIKHAGPTIAAAGVIIDVSTGEIMAMASMPDYDPNSAGDALKKENLNRMSAGTFEMGSTFKAITTAMAIDSGKMNVNSTFDARSALRYGRFTIDDYKGKNRVLTLPEVFIYSSNIGTAKMALNIGVEGHKAFLRKMGQLERLRTELPESAEPILPQKWGELNTITIAFGHGLAVAPLQAMMGTAALVNGGHMMAPTFLKRTPEEAKQFSKRVIKPETSEAMRYVLRLNAERGSATRAAVAGFFVGGKTGSTDQAGQTFVGVAERDGTSIAVVLMRAPTSFGREASSLLDWGFRAAPVTAGIAALLLSGMAGFQIALAAGAPWGAVAWGGTNPGVLPRGLRVSSAGSGVVYVLLAVAARSTLLPAQLRRRILTVASGGMVVGTVMNLASPSNIERTLWTPVAAALAAVLWLARSDRAAR